MKTQTLLQMAGLAQLALAAGSLAIPRILGWREHAARLPDLTRQVFWTYALYIWSAHVAFGLASVLAPEVVLREALVAGFIAAWWSVRLALHFTWLDTGSARPPGAIFVAAEIALVALFTGCAALYGFVTWSAL